MIDHDLLLKIIQGLNLLSSVPRFLKEKMLFFDNQLISFKCSAAGYGIHFI